MPCPGQGLVTVSVFSHSCGGKTVGRHEGSNVAGILSRKWLQSRRADGGARRFLGLRWGADRSEVMGKKSASLIIWLMLVIS